ncbi:MAG: GNAT family N-acetyltransferase [Allorhizobium sp.]
MMHSPDIRPLRLEDVEQLVGWAGAEGWNPGRADAQAFYSADPAGFIGCFVAGELVAGISAVRYGNNFGFIGLYICRPDHRGKGLGKRVWDAGMAHLDGRTIGLDGVPEQQANYSSMGFAPVYQTWRWSGPRLAASTLTDADIHQVTADMLPALLAFDRRFFPAPRGAFLEAWVSLPRIARVLMKDGVITGYGVARQCLDGFKIGPLFAEDTDSAHRLLAALSAQCGSGPVHIDVPETSAEFASTLAADGMTESFVTARMYRGPAPQADLSGVFAVTTLELG